MAGSRGSTTISCMPKLLPLKAVGLRSMPGGVTLVQRPMEPLPVPAGHALGATATVTVAVSVCPSAWLVVTTW